MKNTIPHVGTIWVMLELSSLISLESGNLTMHAIVGRVWAYKTNQQEATPY